MMNRATELKVPPNPSMTATKAIRCRGPGLPARTVPNDPDKAHDVILHANVPIGNEGHHEFNFIILLFGGEFAVETEA